MIILCVSDLWKVICAQNETIVEHLDVIISGQQKLQLPADELTFKGDVAGNQTDLSWIWEVTEKPEESEDIQISGKFTRKLHLSKLIAGNYTLLLEVKNDPLTKFGNGTYHFIVLEPVKVPHPPKAVIKDPEQTILTNQKVKSEVF